MTQLHSLLHKYRTRAQTAPTGTHRGSPALSRGDGAGGSGCGAFSNAGRDLVELHIDYEMVKPYSVTVVHAGV